MGPTPFVLVVVTVFLLANHPTSVDSQSRSAEDSDGAFQGSMGPPSFVERQTRRKRQNKPRAGKGRPAGGNVPGHQEGNEIMTIYVPNCEEEGMVLIQGFDNYYVKCVQNHRHGGFYRAIYLCPHEIRSVTDTSQCVPPPDCSSCGAGGRPDELGFNGLV